MNCPIRNNDVTVGSYVLVADFEMLLHETRTITKKKKKIFRILLTAAVVFRSRAGVQSDVSHAHAQRQEAVHVSRVRQRVLSELRSQETLAETARRGVAPRGRRPSRRAAVATHRTAFTVVTRSRPRRLVVVPAGRGAAPAQRHLVARLGSVLRDPPDDRVPEAYGTIRFRFFFRFFFFAARLNTCELITRVRRVIGFCSWSAVVFLPYS